MVSPITNNLERTKSATFVITLPHPNPEAKGFPIPMGTGFFISQDGYCITARHVLEKKDTGGKVICDPNGRSILHNSGDIRFRKETNFYLENIFIIREWPQFDLVLLKADFEKNKHRDEFKNKKGFDYLEVDSQVMQEGTEVYAFGYPLPKFEVNLSPEVMVGFHYYCPRVTSAIISSHNEMIGPVRRRSFPVHYVIDKALNYGNSGGPIVVVETGKVISVCSRFQPVAIPQQQGNVIIPSLYGISTSLKNIENYLKEYI